MHQSRENLVYDMIQRPSIPLLTDLLILGMRQRLCYLCFVV